MDFKSLIISLMERVDISKFKNKKIALVLSGGVIKAASWHLGVSLALEELGFSFKHNESPPSNDGLEISTYVGSSAGSLVNLYFASGYAPLDVIEATLDKGSKSLKPISYKDILYFKNVKKKPLKSFSDPFQEFPIFIKSFLRPFSLFSGFFSTHGLHKYMKNHVLLSDSFDHYKADMFVVATQLDHSRKVIFGKYHYPNPSHDSTATYYTGISVAEAISASMSVPPFYSPYPVRNPRTEETDYYIDGEIRETLSTHVAIDNNCQFIISSWTHTPYHYHDEVGSLVNYGLPAICLQAIHLMIQKKIVASRARRNAAEDIINTVNDYMVGNKFSNTHRRKIMSILERKLHFRPDVHFIDIFPTHENIKMFFANSFSLDPAMNAELVKMGHQRTLDIFRNHEWECIH